MKPFLRNSSFSIVLSLFTFLFFVLLSNEAVQAQVETKLTASDGENGDQFGLSVSLSGERALVGRSEESVYVFERQSDGSWFEVAKLTASDGGIGSSTSISGQRALFGAPRDNERGNNAGAAYVFERQNDGSWLEVAKLLASDAAAEHLFGWAVVISGDRLLVGAILNGTGVVYVFERQGDGSWLEVTKLTASDAMIEDLFGTSVSLLGDRALVGALADDDNGNSSYQFFDIIVQ